MLLILLLVSIFIAWYVTKRLSEERFDKELVIADLRDIESCMKKTLELYDRSNNNNEILIHLNQLHILIQRFQRTIDIDGMDMRALQNASLLLLLIMIQGMIQIVLIFRQYNDMEMI
jgi:hypothetical protein